MAPDTEQSTAALRPARAVRRLSKVHFHLTSDPLAAAGSGEVREKQTAYLSGIIQKVNDLFDGELTDNDKLVYVNNVLRGKLLESETLIQSGRFQYAQHHGSLSATPNVEARTMALVHQRNLKNFGDAAVARHRSGVRFSEVRSLTHHAA